MSLRPWLVSLAAVALLAGCAAGNENLRNLTTTSMQQLIVDNQTTMAQVISALGEPQVRQQEADGTDVVQYTWARSRPSAKNFIPLTVIKEFPTTKKTLRLWVNSAGVVIKHELTGLFYVHRVPLIGEDTDHSMRPLTQDELNSLADPDDPS